MYTRRNITHMAQIVYISLLFGNKYRNILKIGYEDEIHI